MNEETENRINKYRKFLFRPQKSSVENEKTKKKKKILHFKLQNTANTRDKYKSVTFKQTNNKPTNFGTLRYLKLKYKLLIPVAQGKPINKIDFRKQLKAAK